MKFLLSACLLFPVLVRGAEAPSPEHGKQLYVKNGCFECHGYAGQGGQVRTTRLAGTKMTPDAFLVFVRNPPPGEMPPYSMKVITNEDLADIWSYIKTFPASRSWKEIRELQF